MQRTVREIIIHCSQLQFHGSTRCLQCSKFLQLKKNGEIPDVIVPFDPLPSSQLLHSCGTSPFQSANHRTVWAISIAVTNYKRGTDSNSLLTVINMHH